MKLLSYIRLVERAFLVTLFLAMVILFFGNVVAREIGGTFASKFAWIEEAVRFMNVFLVFIALGLALEKGRHVGIDTLRDHLPAKLRSVLLKVIDGVGFLFSIYLSWLGIGLVKFVLMTGQRSPTLDFPVGWVYSAPVIGFGLLALRFALSFFGIIDRFGNHQTPVEAEH
ncbi:MAG: TRAP transporter small permease [Rhodobacteraceae bacterium]|nr:TRAP transporter small permease [Paracoccaceae bacterium]